MGTMDEALQNLVIDTVKYTYLKELENNYTGFFRFMCCNILKHLLNKYRNIMTADLEANNQRMKEPIEFSSPIDKYFK